MELKTVEQEVKKILEKNEAARCDDMKLYEKYVSVKLKALGHNFTDAYFVKIFKSRNYRVYNGIATFDSVGRARRKLQEKYEELRPSESSLEARRDMERKYRKYAREGAEE